MNCLHQEWALHGSSSQGPGHESTGGVQAPRSWSALSIPGLYRITVTVPLRL